MALSKSLTDLNLYDKNYLMVASIDFGTTFSGYAFSFRSDKNDIKMNNNWGADSGCQSYKTPTSVLLDHDGCFLAFGYEAETLYNQLILSKGTGSCELYRHFKMKLYNETDLTRSTEVESVSGKRAKAMGIFTHAVRYLHGHLLDAIKIPLEKELSENDIRWVMTVPAIWSERSKTFMREVAYKAGLIEHMRSKHFLICLEPEAASIYCRQLDTKTFKMSDKGGETLLRKPGTKFMIIDAGGGTIDITAHETDAAGKVKELVPATGGPWGGTLVDANFIDVLKEVFGADFLNKFQSQYPSDWFKLRLEFETMKKKFDPKKGDAKMAFQLSYNIFNAYKNICGGDLSERLKNCRVQGVEFGNGALIFENSFTLKRVFLPVVDIIVSHVQKVLLSITLKNIDLALLVGGFGECKVLQDSLTEVMSPKIPILCPTEAGITILKGAVLFGHSPLVITSRIARKTYGESILSDFDPTTDDAERLVEKEAGQLIRTFQVFVKKGERIQVGEERTFTSSPVRSTQTSATTRLLSSDTKNVKYPDDPTVNLIGKITLPLPDISRGLDREVETTVYFGATEIHVKAREVTDGMRGKKVKATIDFLSE